MKVKSRRTLFVAFTLAVISSIGLAHSKSSLSENDTRIQGEEKQKQQLLSVENRWLEAEGDPDTLESILAPDFVHVLPGGIISKDQQLAFMRKHPAPKTRAAKQFEDLHIRIYGTVGVVNGIVRASEVATTRRTLFTDVFVHRNGQWEAVSAQELPAANPSQGDR